MMFSLSFIGGSKSAEGGPNPLADLDWGGPYLLADLDRGVQIRWDTGNLSWTERHSCHFHVSPTVEILRLIFT